MILATQGIGGYTFIYFIVACSIPLLYLFFQSNDKRLKFICLSLYVLFSLVVLKSNYMTALLTMCICSLIIIFFNYFSGKRKNGVRIITIFMIVGGLIGSMNFILELFEDILPPRITSVIYGTPNQSIVDSLWDELLSDRLPTILNSLESFTEHPLFGLLGSQGIDTSGEIFINFGQHSYIMDTLAIYGIFIGIFSLYIIYINFTNDNCPNDKYSNTNSLSISMFICVIMLYLLNNATESIALVVGIIYPLTRDFLVCRRQ